MESFGRKFVACEIASERAALEKAHGKSERFAAFDALISEQVARGLRGERTVLLKEDKLHFDKLTLNSLNNEQKQFIQQTFAVERQQERGNWNLPEKITIDGGILNLAWHFRSHTNFPHESASRDFGTVLLKDSPETVFLAYVLTPLIRELVYPIELKSSLAGTFEHEELKNIWSKIDEFYADLGFGEISELAVFRPRGGWSKLGNIASQHEAKRLLLNALSKNAHSEIGTFYRITVLRELAGQYYKKAKADGVVKRKQVITKTFQPLLTGFFGGDWLALVDYLGEKPHPDEQIVTALPKTQINVGGASRAAEVALESGLPVDEVAKIAAALWQTSGGASPIEERVTCLKDYWRVFGEIHERQAPGMKPLWGLVEENDLIEFERNPNYPFYPQLYLELLPENLIRRIENLWGTTMLHKYPERIVTEPFPHFVMAKVFGPALYFWQNCALTAWFLCEGPSSRTDMAGLAHHQRYYLSELENIGTPVDPKMFDELIKAEAKMGPEERIEGERTTTTIDYGISITMSVSYGSRRAGFEKLRNIIIAHCRVWTERFLEQYLKNRYESEIGTAAKSFFLKTSEKGGKSPTLKQFANTAAPPTKHWFGGDISQFYAAINEKTPVHPERNLLMPKDKIAFVKKVAESLPAENFNWYDNQPADDGTKKYFIQDLAQKSHKFVQIIEASGRNPTLKEFAGNFKHRSMVLHKDENQAWLIYERKIEEVLKTFNSQKSSAQAAIILQSPTAKVEKPEIATVSPFNQSIQRTVSQIKDKQIPSQSKPEEITSLTAEKNDEQSAKAASWWNWIFQRK